MGATALKLKLMCPTIWAIPLCHTQPPRASLWAVLFGQSEAMRGIMA